MTAHPIELIAGMDDGLDLDQKDRVVRHIAACDTCRSVARTMQRIDGLIAMPEPALPLPERATRREGVRVAGWVFALAAAVTLVATMAVLVGSSRQTQVASGDACGVLAVAARPAGVGAATGRAAAIELPASLSESWTACAYGERADRAGPWLLFRSRPTEGREVRGLLVALTTTDTFALGKFSPTSTVDGTERWISTRASGLGQAMAVLADPYFFVVTAPNHDATEGLAEAVLAELRRRPWPPLLDASKTDACAVITRAASSAGLPAKDASGHPLTTHRHWLDMSIAADNWPFGGGIVLTNVCGFESDVALKSPPIKAFSDPHLILRDEPTTRQQANGLLDPLNFPTGDPDSHCCFSVYGWVQIEAGMWITHGEDGPWAAVAVSDEPYFFAVTEATDEAAIQLARAVLVELKRP